MPTPKNKFDIYEPAEGHFDRFTERLELSTHNKRPSKERNLKWYLMAASIALVVSLWYNFKPDVAGYELADVSPEMKETQSYFTFVINNEINQINGQQNADNKFIIDNALTKVQSLEEAYEKLTIELKNSGFDKRIINAMIFNYQQRIEILQDLLNQINNFKNSKDETNIQNYV